MHHVMCAAKTLAAASHEFLSSIQSHEEMVVDGDYEKVECLVLYYHKPSGYYYDPVSEQDVHS